jgi:adenylate cyclase
VVAHECHWQQSITLAAKYEHTLLKGYYIKKHSLRIIISLSVTMFFVLNATGTFKLGFIKRLEFWAYDHRLNLTMPEGQDSRIVIVDIDEKSLSEDGRWPWSRDKVATVVENLIGRYHAAVVGFDIVFAERDHSSGLTVLEQFGKTELRGSAEYLAALDKVRPRLNYDNILAEKFKDRPVVLGYYFSGVEQKQKGQVAGMLPKPVFTKDNFRKGNTNIIKMDGYGANIPELQQSAASAGHFNPDPDIDGVTRRIPMLIEYDGGYYEPLSLAMVRVLLGMPDLKPGLPEGHQKGSDYDKLEWLSLSDLKIPVDDRVTALIPYRGKQGSFPYISASDVLHGRVKPELLEGAIVLVGTTAPGLMDLRSTPVSSVYAGVEIHANMIAGILDQSIKYSPAYVMGGEVVILLVSGILLSLLLPLLSPVKSTLVAVVILLSAGMLDFVAWQDNLVLPLASIIILIPLLYAFNMSYGFLVEARAKHHITGLFGQYVPPQIVSSMSKDPQRFTMQAESREMTVLFTDVAGFTAISEKLTPKELAQFMNEYLTAMTTIIYEHGGTVDKYIGDAIMAFWGAPLDDPDHALHAVQAALAMRKRMVTLQLEMTTQGFPEIKIGIGINSGQMRVGNMGSSYRVAYTVMGDAVNLAARLEGLTRQYDTWIIVGEVTRSKVEGYSWRELDLVRVKGKNEPVAIHEPCGTESLLDKQYSNDITLFNEMVAAYRSKCWDAAEAMLEELIGNKPDRKLYRFYLNRIQQYRIEPPPAEWDGVSTFTTK